MYKSKYMKYKAKYMQLKKQIGGMHGEVREEGGVPVDSNVRSTAQAVFTPPIPDTPTYDTFIKIEIIDTDGNVVSLIKEDTKKIPLGEDKHMKITTTAGEIYAYTKEIYEPMLLSHPNNSNVFLLLPEDSWEDLAYDEHDNFVGRYIPRPTFFTIEGNLSFTIDDANKQCVNECYDADYDTEHPNKCGNLEFNIKVNGNDLSFYMDVKSLGEVQYEDGYISIDFDEEVSTTLSWLTFHVVIGKDFDEYNIKSTYHLVPITDGVLKNGDKY
jgi:hypothetical protein